MNHVCQLENQPAAVAILALATVDADCTFSSRARMLSGCLGVVRFPEPTPPELPRTGFGELGPDLSAGMVTTLAGGSRQSWFYCFDKLFSTYSVPAPWQDHSGKRSSRRDDSFGS